MSSYGSHPQTSLPFRYIPPLPIPSVTSMAPSPFPPGCVNGERLETPSEVVAPRPIALTSLAALTLTTAMSVVLLLAGAFFPPPLVDPFIVSNDIPDIHEFYSLDDPTAGSRNMLDHLFGLRQLQSSPPFPIQRLFDDVSPPNQNLYSTHRVGQRTDAELESKHRIGNPLERRGGPGYEDFAAARPISSSSSSSCPEKCDHRRGVQCVEGSNVCRCLPHHPIVIETDSRTGMPTLCTTMNSSIDSWEEQNGEVESKKAVYGTGEKGESQLESKSKDHIHMALAAVAGVRPPSLPKRRSWGGGGVGPSTTTSPYSLASEAALQESLTGQQADFGGDRTKAQQQPDTEYSLSSVLEDDSDVYGGNARPKGLANAMPSVAENMRQQYAAGVDLINRSKEEISRRSESFLEHEMQQDKRYKDVEATEMIVQEFQSENSNIEVEGRNAKFEIYDGGEIGGMSSTWWSNEYGSVEFEPSQGTLLGDYDSGEDRITTRSYTMGTGKVGRFEPSYSHSLDWTPQQTHVQPHHSAFYPQATQGSISTFYSYHPTQPVRSQSQHYSPGTTNEQPEFTACDNSSCQPNSNSNHPSSPYLLHAAHPYNSQQLQHQLASVPPAEAPPMQSMQTAPSSTLPTALTLAATPTSPPLFPANPMTSPALQYIPPSSVGSPLRQVVNRQSDSSNGKQMEIITEDAKKDEAFLSHLLTREKRKKRKAGDQGEQNTTATITTTPKSSPVEGPTTTVDTRHVPPPTSLSSLPFNNMNHQQLPPSLPREISYQHPSLSFNNVHHQHPPSPSSHENPYTSLPFTNTHHQQPPSPSPHENSYQYTSSPFTNTHHQQPPSSSSHENPYQQASLQHLENIHLPLRFSPQGNNLLQHPPPSNSFQHLGHQVSSNTLFPPPSSSEESSPPRLDLERPHFPSLQTQPSLQPTSPLANRLSRSFDHSEERFWQEGEIFQPDSAANRNLSPVGGMPTKSTSERLDRKQYPEISLRNTVADATKNSRTIRAIEAAFKR